jgi:superfamily II DNA or RNA helicase
MDDPVARSVRLRPWQKTALDAFADANAADFLAVATPGAGKTTFALTAARQHLAASPASRLVVVAPTQHLKTQWADAAVRFDLHLEPEWSAASGRLPADMHGIVTTYQQVAASAPTLRAVADGAFVVFDEIHHAGDDRAWGTSVQHAFDGAARRLSLSGTPFRSDTRAIPFVRYAADEAHPDFEYGYGEALADGGVVRPVYFPRINGHMEWTAPDGTFHAHGFDDALDHARANQRLRTALSLDGEWLPAVLDQAHELLTDLRTAGGHPDAGGLVIAMDQDHARGIAELLWRRHRVSAVVTTSDDPAASGRIARFAASGDPWIVAVRMVSEGVDIPRLRVGVFATNTTTELFFRQAVGRLVRWQRGQRGQRAYLLIPDDARLRALAGRIAEQRRHSLARGARADAGERVAAVSPDQKEQLSLFAALSAVPLGQSSVLAAFDDDVPEPPDHDDDEMFTITLDPAPALRGAATTTAVLSRREHKQRLRDANAERVRILTRFTGMSHAQVNAELNRLAGLTRVTEATADQLETRLRHADRWLSRF